MGPQASEGAVDAGLPPSGLFCFFLSAFFYLLDGIKWLAGQIGPLGPCSGPAAATLFLLFSYPTRFLLFQLKTGAGFIL